jgi:hypothetical protein
MRKKWSGYILFHRSRPWSSEAGAVEAAPVVWLRIGVFRNRNGDAGSRFLEVVDRVAPLVLFVVRRFRLNSSTRQLSTFRNYFEGRISEEGMVRHNRLDTLTWERRECWWLDQRRLGRARFHRQRLWGHQRPGDTARVLLTLTPTIGIWESSRSKLFYRRPHQDFRKPFRKRKKRKKRKKRTNEQIDRIQIQNLVWGNRMFNSTQNVSY